MSKKQIEEAVRHSLEVYFKDLRGEDPSTTHYDDSCDGKAFA